MKVEFLLQFSTQFGQNIFISGNHPLLGSDNLSKAIPLNYLDSSYWTLALDFQNFDQESVKYSYLLKNEDGFEIMEWGGDRGFHINKSIQTLVLRDIWNHAGSLENVFYTDPFKNVLLLKNKQEKVPFLQSVKGVTFKIKAPLLKANEVVCITGDSEEIGKWGPTKAIPMKFDGNWWFKTVFFENQQKHVNYKYGIFDHVNSTFIGFEDGENRVLTLDYRKCTILQDGFARFPIKSWKGTGVAVPVFSLRSEHSFGVGEFNDIKLLADWASLVGLKMIQLLPVNDTSATNTWMDSYPYASISAFALHPIYINLDTVAGVKHPEMQKFKKNRKTLNTSSVVDYEEVLKVKLQVLKTLYKEGGNEFLSSKNYMEFYDSNNHWLLPYAVFCYFKNLYGTSDFNQWLTFSKYEDLQIKQLVENNLDIADEINFHCFVQYHLHLQLKDATSYAHSKGLIVKGDIPIGIYRFSVDAWMEPELYHMEMQAGAPPDDFAVHGQNWGFPTYNWENMSKDGYQWWYKRFVQMGNYFDAFRIDHILGFFRIWSIPIESTQGIMGHFVPSIPVHINEFSRNQLSIDLFRYCRPFITTAVLNELFGERKQLLLSYLIENEQGQFELKEEFNSQSKVDAFFSNDNTEDGLYICQSLKDLLSNVILFEVEGSNGHQFHFRFNMDKTTSFKYLDGFVQTKLKELYIDYFFRKQDDYWKIQAMNKLPALKRSTNMLICGEDLGLVPSCVPDVMQQLGILSLEIQRMPKLLGSEFFNPADAPYLSVVTPSTHDMSTVRGWWEEDREKTRRFFNTVMGQWGEAPHYCEPWINKYIVRQHMHSPAMWCVFQLQDLMGMSDVIRRENPEDERINIPANPKHYWQYRMHLSLEDLMKQSEFTSLLSEMVISSGRN